MRSPRLRTRREPPPVAPREPTSTGKVAQRPLLVRRYDSLLPTGPDRVVVLLADDGADPRLARFLREFSADHVHVIAAQVPSEPTPDGRRVTFHAAPDPAGISASMRLIGAADLVIVLISADGETHARMWEQLFFFLKADGAYVVLRESVARSAGDGSAGLLNRLLETAALQDGSASEADGSDVGATTALKQELADTASRVVIDRGFVIVGKRLAHHLKVREAEADELLAARAGDTRLRVLATLPAGELRSTTTVTSHPSSVPVHSLETTIRYPQLSLREYTGRVGLVAQSLLITDDAALPDSFRWHQQPDPVNPAAISASADFVRVNPKDLPTEHLAGSYYLLDNSFFGHFGHLMTEVVSKLWGWDQAKADFPALKAIYRTRHDWERERLMGRRLFEAYGIAAQDIVRVDQSVWVDRMVGATPMWHNALPHYVHPQIAAVWDRLTAGIDPIRYDGARKIFVSRQADLKKRPCRNAGEVEDLFAANGFDVVYPELLDLRAQAGLFRDADVVAGFGGSALFNMLYCEHLQTLIVLNHESYTARNEHLYSLVKGCDVHYFWSDPDLRHPEGGWTETAFRSPWEFDFARNREQLTDLLNTLD
jgi:capsular polysaccharide biosynthesis protein